MELHQRADGVTVVNDAYNANPDSMRAALETLAELGRPRAPADLGGARRHARAGRLRRQPSTRRSGAFVAERGIDRLVAVGEYADAMAAGGAELRAGRRGRSRAFADKADARPRCSPVSRPATWSWSRRPVA